MDYPFLASELQLCEFISTDFYQTFSMCEVLLLVLGKENILSKCFYVPVQTVFGQSEVSLEFNYMRGLLEL